MLPPCQAEQATLPALAVKLVPRAALMAADAPSPTVNGLWSCQVALLAMNVDARGDPAQQFIGNSAGVARDLFHRQGPAP